MLPIELLRMTGTNALSFTAPGDFCLLILPMSLRLPAGVLKATE
jgi:hypothetical protein